MITIIVCIIATILILHYLFKKNSESSFRNNPQNDIKLEKQMKPCPCCGHRAITIYYCGENEPHFFTAECGAYERRDNCGHINGTIAPNDYFKDEPPMTEEQKKCSFYAGYCSDAPHFQTRLKAIKWWNKMVSEYKKK